ncbi:MAG TPA: xanthine dehydrogenase family protein subunit M [Trebonia sp.]|jgi:carbon-monoxide dehydrogenase medium subunit
MKPSKFTYHAPETVTEALSLLDIHSDQSKVLAGGQSLFPVLSFRLAAPEHLIDINRLPGLDTLARTADGTGWRIPALVRQRQAERSPELAASAPLLTEALAQVAHPQIRNRGTICGSLAHADSSAEMPSVMLTLNARMTIASASGTRTVSADDFFLFHMTTAVEPHELLLAVEFDDPAPGTYFSFAEFAPRKGDFCLAGVAASATFATDGTVSAARVVAAGVSATPLRLGPVEELITGTVLDAGTLAAAKDAAFNAVDPAGDVHADAAYRRQLASVLVRRALADVRAKADVTAKKENSHEA